MKLCPKVSNYWNLNYWNNKYYLEQTNVAAKNQPFHCCHEIKLYSTANVVAVDVSCLSFWLPWRSSGPSALSLPVWRMLYHKLSSALHLGIKPLCVKVLVSHWWDICSSTGHSSLLSLSRCGWQKEGHHVTASHNPSQSSVCQLAKCDLICNIAVCSLSCITTSGVNTGQ